jgi:hypothetical protein
MVGLQESAAIARFHEGTGFSSERVPRLFPQRGLKAFDSPEKSPKIG